MRRDLYTSYSSTCSSSKVCDASRWNYVHILPSEHPGTWYTSRNNISMHLGIISSNNASAVLLPLLLCCCCKKYATRFSAFFVTPTLPALSLLESATFFVTPTLPALSRVPPAVCPSLLESEKNTLQDFPPFSLRLPFQLSRVYLRPSVLRCWRALLLRVLPFCNLFSRTYIRRRLIPYYDSGPLHKQQIYIRPIFHFYSSEASF